MMIIAQPIDTFSGANLSGESWQNMHKNMNINAIRVQNRFSNSGKSKRRLDEQIIRYDKERIEGGGGVLTYPQHREYTIVRTSERERPLTSGRRCTK